MRAPAIRLPWLGLLAAVGGLGAAAAGACRAGAQSRPLSPQEARKWLSRIHAAAHERNYQGTLVFSADGALSSARVAHFCDGAQSYERVEVLDGRMQQIYRHNDRVRHAVAALARGGGRGARPAAGLAAPGDRAARRWSSYELREQGTEHVAGREAQVLLLSPRDALRFAQRLWVDSRSGLMLRADVLGPRQQVLESSAFSQVEIDVKPQAAERAAADEAPRRLPPGAAARSETRTLDSEGWVLTARCPASSSSAACAARSIRWTAPASRRRCCRRCSPTA